MAHHEKLAKRQMFWGFWECLCMSAAHLFSWWHNFLKIKACLLFVQGPSASFLSRGLFKMQKWEGCLHQLSRDPNSPLHFFLFLILWFTDLFLSICAPIVIRLHLFKLSSAFNSVWHLPIKWAIGGQRMRAAHANTECKLFGFFTLIIFPSLDLCEINLSPHQGASD